MLEILEILRSCDLTTCALRVLIRAAIAKRSGGEQPMGETRKEELAPKNGITAESGQIL